MSALRRVFDPFRPVYLRAPTMGGQSAPPSRAGRVAGRSRQADEALRRLAPQQGRALNPQAQEALRRIAAQP